MRCVETQIFFILWPNQGLTQFTIPASILPFVYFGCYTPHTPGRYVPDPSVFNKFSCMSTIMLYKSEAPTTNHKSILLAAIWLCVCSQLKQYNKNGGNSRHLISAKSTRA
jgi:hypothetical protein